MKQEMASPKRQKGKQINGKCNNIGSADANKKISLQKFLPLSEAEIQGPSSS
jgi:hypothetical protein